MRNVFIVLLALGIAQASFAVIVDGYCYLEGETNYSGTKVKFIEVSLSAETDSMYTNVTGFFSIDLVPGTYDVEYSHATFVSIELIDQSILGSQILDPVTLLPEASSISGNLSGALGPGSFYVVGNIDVRTDDTLYIQSGTRLLFAGHYKFTVNGLFEAIGSEEDSIIFTRLYPTEESKWWGIHFQNAHDSCRLEYCLIEYGKAEGFDDGGGVDIDDSSPTIINCIIRNNEADYGGGISLCNGSAVIENCTINNNSAVWGGGGVKFLGTGSQQILRNCVISNNFAQDRGGGLVCYSGASPSIINCTISGNASPRDGGVYCAFSSPTISSTVIAFSVGAAIGFNHSPSCQIEYCDIYGGGFDFDDGPSGAPLSIGELVVTNANIDSCDTYYNIFLDPLLADTAAGDFSLSLDSPCIDAGDPSLPRDPDSTVTDIGAFFFDQKLVILPTKLKFNSVFVGDDSTLTCVLRNWGDSAITIQSVSIDDTAFSHDWSLADSMLASGDSLQIEVTFA
ncbi:right-handed parallel beta-helix repeat-containing protein, partial [bacterium]|nr:right-handed parallel beta-helix repeat-containing protein [bacterium]